MDREGLATDRFACTERERCVFETGIKLATIYHQYVGTPFNAVSVASLEEAISRSIEVQPYVVSAVVRIDRSVIPEEKDEYSYLSLTGDMIDAVVKVRMGSTTVTAEMRYDEELRYPLMFVSSIE
jgi:hypothetical protein